MSPPIARAAMSLADRIAPAYRATWSAAMRQEFEALDGGPDSLGWAGPSAVWPPPGPGARR